MESEGRRTSELPTGLERKDPLGAGEGNPAPTSDAPAAGAYEDSGSGPEMPDEEDRDGSIDRGNVLGVDQGNRATTPDQLLERVAENAGSAGEENGAFDPPTAREPNAVSGTGESHPAASSNQVLQQAGSGANEADEESRRRPWTLLIELLVVVLLVLVSSDKSAERADEGAASGRGEGDDESRPANPRDDPPGAGRDDDPPAVVGSHKSATSKRPLERHDENADTRLGGADEENRPSGQPISDKRDDPPGGGNGDDPPAVVGSHKSATSKRPLGKHDENAGTWPGEADETSRPTSQPISDERDDPPGGDQPATLASDKSTSSERAGEKRGEDARPRPGEVDEESPPSDQPPGSEHGAALSDSDRAATSSQSPEGADEDAHAGEKAAERGRTARRPWVLAIGIVVVALLIAGGLYYWWTSRNLESTDDAFTDGRAVTIAPQVAGEVISLDVNDNQFVKQGEAVIHIDPRQYKNSRDQAEGALATAKAQHSGQQLAAEIAKKNFPAQLEQAKAQLESAKANLARTNADYARQISLQKPATTQQDVDQAATALWQAEAQVKLAEAQVKQNSPVPQQIGQSEAQVRQLKGQVEQAQAQLAQAELNLSWAIVTAPQDGWITRRNVEKGNYVVAGQQIMSIVTPEVWVTANFKETQLTYMRPGQRVKIRIDAYPSLDVRGHVDSIQRGSGSKFTAFPPENATGNFVKIVQRVPVKIVIDSGIPADISMPLGISVVPTVTVR